MTAEKNKLPSGWIQSSLGKMAQSMGGGTPSKADPDFWTDGTIPWVSPKDMKVFKLVSSEDKLTLKALDRLSLIPAESVLVVVRSGILSRTFPVAISKQPVTINQDMRAFVPKEGILADYLAWQLIAKEQEILSACSKDGTTVASIEGPVLANFPLLLAPAAEQTRIVEKLEELLSDLDAGVAELKAAQRKLGQYRQSLLKAAVEGALTASWRAQHTPTETGAQLLERILKERRARWEAKQLAKFEEQGKAPPKDWQKKYPEPVRPDTSGLPELPEGWVWASVDQISPDDLANGRSVPSADNGAKVLRLTAMKDGWIDLNEYKHGDWSDEDAQQFAVTEGDILIVRGNGSLSLVGRAGSVGKVSTQVAYPDTMIRLRVIDAVVSPAWIGLVWRTRVVRSHIERRARTSAGIYKISQPDIVSAPIPVPPLAEQECIQQWLEQQSPEIDSLHSVLNSEIQRSAAQRKNILKAAFSGELVPQDPDDEPAAVLLERIQAERVSSAGGRGRKGRPAASDRSHAC